MKILNKNKKKKGFTLIELVAVVAIIGILAALLVPKIAGYITDAKKTKVIDQARKVVMAVETANTKEDVTLPVGTTITQLFATNATGTIKVAQQYLDPAAEGKGKVVPNLPDATTFANCKAITEGQDFEINNNGILSKIGNTAIGGGSEGQ
ncbi:type II secretion system protein [Clostridium baratii]|uniref:type II secretion system protein n=1 Tax=Clostridium baratii TaxID=1561 RepID=UPI00097FA72A|nr:type II secretion system protein [Clostridium baratii]AQM59404.1 hypothetical protein NPD11_1515 [Clostridium baratii]